MNIAIVDDLQEDRTALRNILSEYAAGKRLNLDVSVFSGGEEFLAAFWPLRYSVIFLDIYMEGMSGIETAAKIREMDDETPVVFLTTSEDSEKAAIHLHVYDYILKSDGANAVRRVMDRILQRSGRREAGYFSFSCDRRNYSVRFKEIICVESGGNNVSIRLKGGETYRPRMTFSSVKKTLMSDERFLEIMRGVIVNMDCILNLSAAGCQLEGEIFLPVNVRKGRQIIQTWQDFLFREARKEVFLS